MFRTSCGAFSGAYIAFTASSEIITYPWTRLGETPNFEFKPLWDLPLEIIAASSCMRDNSTTNTKLRPHVKAMSRWIARQPPLPDVPIDVSTCLSNKFWRPGPPRLLKQHHARHRSRRTTTARPHKMVAVTVTKLPQIICKCLTTKMLQALYNV